MNKHHLVNAVLVILQGLLMVSLVGSTPAAAFAPSADSYNGNSQAANPDDQAPAWTQSGYRVFLPVVGTKLPSAAGKIYDTQVVTPNVARYDKFEIQFKVKTSAINLDLPYDANPPAGLSAGSGISVNVLFTPDNWRTVYTQPAFWYQPFAYSDGGGKDHLTPNGAPRWAARFAPQSAGSWQYRISVQDKDGLSYYPAIEAPGIPFTVGAASGNAYTRRGFLRVSANDPRYFEFQDGEPFVGIGFNDSFKDVASTEAKMQTYEQNKMNFMRVWMSGSGINGSQWSSWASNFLSGDGYLPGTNFDTQNTYHGHDVSLRLDDGNPCFYSDFWQGAVPVEPNTNYTIWARVKLNGIGGGGFVIKQGDWLDKGCASSSTGNKITQPVTGSTDWITVQGTYTTGGGQSWLPYLYLARQDSGGQVYIDEVHMYRTDDPNKSELLREPYANSHMYFDQMSSASWDMFIDSAQRHGVYLDIVIDEKNEWIRTHIGADGKMTSFSNDNFYAAPGTKVRWLEEAWWRYLIARWGYSTAVHTFEYVNEGDPYNGHHYEAANAMARYIHKNDPARHMVTTSFWSSFPNQEFWSNPAYQDIDYAQLHAYIATGWGKDATIIDNARVETNPAYIHSGNGSARIDNSVDANFAQDFTPRGLVVKGQGTWTIRYWMKAENFTANCPYGSSGGMQRIRYYIDPGGSGPQGVVPVGADGKDFICTSPGGTYDWQQLSGTFTLSDNNPHGFLMRLENSNGTGGRAWIDDVELVNPSGQVAEVLGRFDTTSMDVDTAWYNHAYGDVFGGGSPVGAHKPLVRGETGIDYEGNQDWNRDLTKDTQGIWLHNNLWGQVNHGGMYDLFWWATETIPASIYSNYLTYANFMAGIPLNNGRYYDISAGVSNGSLRAWGQRDDTNGRMHLWIQNTQHEWTNVVAGQNAPAISGQVTIYNVPSGTYAVEWWDPYKTSSAVIKTETVSANGSLTLNLPYGLTTDIAVKLTRK